MNTKEKILKEALKQFNASGVEQVTTRHIAKGLSMSQGNLHYHFPNKDELIEALYQNFTDQIVSVSRQSTAVVFEKEEVLLSMQDSFRVMYAYRFLFRDNEAVWRRLPNLKRATLALLNRKKEEIRALIETYKKRKIFRADISDAQLDYLANQFLFTIATWLNASEYLDIPAKRVDYFSRFIFRQWLPYLIPKEMASWEQLLK